MKSRLLVIIILACSWSAPGQNAPAFRQFATNPYLFNPAFAGANDYAEFSLVYRQQWMGFNQSPAAGGFTLLYPSQNRVSLAMNFLSQEAVALRTTSTQLTFAYRIPITSKQFLFFGLSGVAGYNDLNLDGVDYSNDPTILNAAATHFYGDANFGLMYQVGGFQFGFALPKLFGQPYFSPQDLVNVRYAQLRNQLYSLRYKFSAGNFSFEPYALYRLNRDLQNWWEAAMMVYFKEKIWTGASYNSTQGIGFFLGMDFKERVRLGYSYELPPSDKEFISASSHEFHLKFRLGRKRMFKWASRFEPKGQAEEVTSFSPTPQIATDTINVLPQVETEVQKTIIEPSVPVKTQAINPVKEEETIKMPSRPPVQPVLATGYYVIAGSFGSLQNARAYAVKLAQMGVADPQVGLNPVNKMQCVYVYSSYDVEECRRIRDQLQLKPATKSVWVLKVN